MKEIDWSDLSQWSPFPDENNLTLGQVIFLTMLYGCVLFQASNLISDGSELLLLVPRYAPIVGSIVLPVLGAVPDGMMVLFSGLGPADKAQTEVAVGVGALCGSTVMLLTLPWFASVFFGRVTLKDGVPTYKRPKNAGDDWEKLQGGSMSPLGTGVGLSVDIRRNAMLMMMTLSGYALVQVPALLVDRQPRYPDFVETAAERTAELYREASAVNKWALVGLLWCSLEFGVYLYLMWTDGSEDSITEAQVKAMQEGHLTLRGAMASFRDRQWATFSNEGDLEQILLDKDSLDEVRRMCKILAPFFAEYDMNGDREIDFDEFRMIFKDVNENINKEVQHTMFKAADTDESGSINFEEFVACFMSYALDPASDIKERDHGKQIAVGSYYTSEAEDSDDGGGGAEEEDVPQDLLNLDPEEQQKVIKKRAFQKMFVGTVLVLAFSDPTVGLFAAMGERTGIPAFYISFVLAPIASNSSEVVAAYNYAKKRTLKSMTTSLSTLEGAAIMNNTFCLGIFFGLVYFQHLAWEFTAETISICTVQILIALSVMCRSTQTVLDGYIVLAYYPLSLGLVYVLENACYLD